MQSSITEATAFVGQLAQFLARGSITIARGFVAVARSINADQRAGSPFAELMYLHRVFGCRPARGRRQKFFDKRSFSTTLSSSASASRRLSLAFSS